MHLSAVAMEVLEVLAMVEVLANGGGTDNDGRGVGNGSVSGGVSRAMMVLVPSGSDGHASTNDSDGGIGYSNGDDRGIGTNNCGDSSTGHGRQ